MQAFRPLSDGFPEQGEAEWRRLARKGKSAGLEPLTSVSMDDIPIGPIYAGGKRPILAMRPPGTPWTIVQRIDRGDADAIRGDIAAAIRGGATGIELVFTSSAASHCRGISLDLALTEVVSGLHATVRLDAGEPTPNLALGLVQSGPRIVAAYDPVATLAAQGGLVRPIEDSAAGIAALIDALDRDARAGIAFVADGRPWHDGGASEVQELTAVLASAVATTRLLVDLGVAPARVFQRLGITLSADADQFLTIAKFRAVRLLFTRLAEVTGIEAASPPVHAETAWRMRSRREPNMNLVRATTAAFAAAVGGADSVTVPSPHFDDWPFNARMARNTQTILLEESSLYRADDPGAGSGAVESLTGDLAAAAWASFTRIEAEGGLIAAVRSGSIQRSVAAMRESRQEKIARRQMALVGVNVNVDPDGAIPVLPAPSPIEAGDASLLRRFRLSEPFESLCARSNPGNGRRAAVLLVRMSRGEDPAESADAFAAGGFEVSSIILSGPADTLSEAFARSGARVACVVCGPDGFSGAARDAAQTLRAAGARAVLAAAPSTDGVAPGAFDAILTHDADLVSLFSDVLDRIAEPDENGQS